MYRYLDKILVIISYLVNSMPPLIAPKESEEEGEEEEEEEEEDLALEDEDDIANYFESLFIESGN